VTSEVYTKWKGPVQPSLFVFEHQVSGMDKQLYGAVLQFVFFLGYKEFRGK
jgi:hypothetical protein